MVDEVVASVICQIMFKRLSLIFFLATICLACKKTESLPSPVQVILEDFEEATRTDLYEALERHDRLEAVEGAGVNGSAGLKASYVGYSRGSERIVVEYPFGEKGTSYTLCYDVKFDEDFQFVRGGKIMGLGPEEKITGGNKVTPGGWSARSNFAAEGGVHTYVYSQNKTGKWGESQHSENPVFEKGRYHKVTLQVRLNDPPSEANGTARIYVDGRLQVDHSNIQFRRIEGEGTLISSVLFETFHGGNTESYAPRAATGSFTTVYAYFDNIEVYRGLYLCQR